MNWSASEESNANRAAYIYMAVPVTRLEKILLSFENDEEYHESLRQNNASSSSLNAVAAVSRNDVWAVGLMDTSDAGARGLMEHWNGTTWSSVSISGPESKMDLLNSLSAISANDIWAVGEFKDYNTRLSRTFALHWDGKQWGLSQWPWKYGQADGSDSFSMNAVVAIDKQHIWGVGSVASITQNPPIDNPPINGATQTFTLFRC